MEWLNYHHLYYFWLVCKEGGFSKAAAKLRIAQSAVSLQVVKLEEFLGEDLLKRTTRGFKLTEAGHVTHAAAEEIFSQGQELVDYFRSGKIKGHFRIGALGGLSKNLQLKILSPLIFDQTLEISLEVGDPVALLERLLAFKLDAILSDHSFFSSESEPLVQREISSEPICLVSRQKKKSGARSDFQAELKRGIYLPGIRSPITSAIVEYFNEESLEFFVRGYVDDIAFLRLLALETDSLVAVPRIGVVRELESKDLHLIYEFRKVRQPYFLVHRQKGKRHPLLSRLMKSGNS